MDAKRTADRYVERGGYMPGEREQRVADDILTVARFIGWHDPGHLMGGRRADDAFAAFCRVIDMERAVLRRIIKGE